ncbi:MULTISPECIES: DUF2949 domain-containing protein [Nostoc]|uniref:DUF2949 domain-containing protein n=1 Tax=Nostoc paludosum FACHB-159 TaxID=2692908 RepID=A0ABR8KK85_9NOSO|nr:MULTISPECIES: DUF2949 domain-containing protein [Nostoc]MBD2683616.1 DUF2949 domain-containing protein [Nostoc sp. FACHB-857]MBD2739941.1 DUF2949 domain-containing protein [Nostoc paludosum FACHB-159]
MEPRQHTKLINFLLEELAIPATAISLALRHVEQTPSLLPMVLWQYGLVTLTQLNQIFDWLEVTS